MERSGFSRNRRQLIKKIILVTFTLAASFLLFGCKPNILTSEAGDVIATVSTEPAPQSVDAPSPSPTENRVVIIPFRTAVTRLNCTYSYYYYRDHPQAWLTENIYIGQKNYTKSDALAIMSENTQDVITNLLKEFFAAALNILRGADSRAIEAEIVKAGAWLDEHPLNSALTDPASEEGIGFTSNLDAYNRGRIGPGSCSDEPMPSPSATLMATPIPPSPTPTNTPTRRPILPTFTRQPEFIPTKPPSRPTNTAVIRPTATERPTSPPPRPTDTPVPEPPTEPPPTQRPPTEPPPEPPTPTSPPE